LVRAAIAFVIGLLAVSCAADDIATRSVVAAVVTVEARGCSLVPARGTGVVIGSDGTLVVTVAHTLAGARDVEVIDGRGRSRSATITWFDPSSDLAVLRVSGSIAPGLPIGRAQPGERAIVAAPRSGQVTSGVEASITRFVAVSIEDIYVEKIVHRDALELSAHVEKGDSGAGVIDPNGAVVGIVYARSRLDPYRAFALDDTEIARAVASAGDFRVANGHCT